MTDYFAAKMDERTIRRSLSHEGLLASMDRTGVAHSITVAVAFDARMTNDDLEPLNAYVRDEVEKADGRLTGFCTVNPFEGAATIRSLRRSIEDNDFRGLKLHQNIQEFFPNDPRLAPVYELMQGYRLPILFHSGGVGLKPIRDKFGRPHLFDDVACDFPDLPIVLGHAGRMWYEETAMLLRKHEHVYADVSTNLGRSERSRLFPMRRLLEVVKGWTGTTDRLLLGSDYPFYKQEDTVEALRELALGFDPEAILDSVDIERIINCNAELFCGRYEFSIPQSERS
jgi:predicted TIM-barrel fold metal-dependent hydrolase